MNIELTPEALDDLRNIQTYIAQDNIAAAARVASEIRRTIDMLATYPEIGTPYHGKVRRLLVSRYPYGVYYKIDQDAQRILIMTILHARQALPTFG